MIYLNPPNPLFKGAHQAFVRTRARGHRFAVLRPASDDALLFIGTLSQTLALRAAFTSSTYLLSQIPGPGRSSDDDLLNSPNPLFKGAIRACGLSIAACLPCSPTPARHLTTYLNPPNPLFKGAHQAFVRTRARGHRFAVLRPASDDALVP